MMGQRLLSFAMATAMLSACGGMASSGSTAKSEALQCMPGVAFGTSEAGLEQSSLCIASNGKTHGFTVEVAATSPQQARGLMFRTALKDDRGMIFPFPEARMASFWMKNTVIPLDIIFIRADGRIENIAANTTPYSTDPVESTAPVVAVLELRGGLAAERGIKPGDMVRWTAN
jgi:uncharacterized protein